VHVLQFSEGMAHGGAEFSYKPDCAFGRGD